MQRWDAGYRHTMAVLERKPWVGEFDPLAGVILHEQAVDAGSGGVTVWRGVTRAQAP